MDDHNFPQKACPIVLNQGVGQPYQILAFEHPRTGRQLVKGTIEVGESPGEAALRELAEESGLQNAVLSRSLGKFEVGSPNQIWHAFICEVNPLPDCWTYRTQDDGGHDFRFFWHNIEQPADESWHQIFRQALEQIRERLERLGLLLAESCRSSGKLLNDCL